MRRALIALTMLAAAGTLVAGCGGSNSGSGGYGSGGTSATTTAPSGTRGGRAYGGGPTSSAAGITTGGTAVTIDNFAFSPPTVRVKAGQKVTWTNKQDVAHTVTADGGAFDHPMPPGAMFAFAVTKAGSFAYHCTIHPAMSATVVVS